MSDIGMQFDGLLTLVALIFSGLISLAVALAAVAIYLATQRPRALAVARRAGLLTVGVVVGATLFTVIWAQLGSFPQGIDLLIVPWIAACLAGCWWLVRAR